MEKERRQQLTPDVQLEVPVGLEEMPAKDKKTAALGGSPSKNNSRILGRTLQKDSFISSNTAPGSRNFIQRLQIALR